MLLIQDKNLNHFFQKLKTMNQSYKRNVVLNTTKSVLNPFAVFYLNLDCNNTGFPHYSRGLRSWENLQPRKPKPLC